VRTLDELCTFLGFRVGALDVARVGGSTHSRLALAGSMVKGFRDQTPTSLARSIAAVQNLPPVTLDARLLSARRGEHPYLLQVRLSPSPGIVWSTRIEYLIGGSAHGGEQNFGAAGGDASPTTLAPGVWEIVAIREGIGQFGLAVLRQNLGKVVVFRRPGPSPASPMPPAAPPAVALVTCQISLDGDNPGSGGVSNFVVSGVGFEADEPVDVFEGSDVSRTAQSDSFGRYAVKVSLLHSLPPVQHVFHARGRRSGRTSLNAGVTL